FLKPFGCHVMILNTLDNLEKFKAKGDEGTKEVTGQDVKKDVPSLRYIVLPNCFHEAHLETSTSNAQDVCNADAPESNGNSNPTTTSTNPSADHIETLAVETPVPTNVWSFVDCPKGVRPIGTKRVLKNKKDERGKVIKNKARQVAQGYTQEEEIDYDDVFAPVTRIKAIRLFLAYASFMRFTTIVATSTTKAEYVAAASGYGQVLWIQNQLLDYGTVPLFPSMLITMGEGSGTPTKPYHTPTSKTTPSPQYELSSSLLPPVITGPLPTVIPSDNPLLGNTLGELGLLSPQVKLLEDRERGGIAQSGEDAPIKGRSIDKGEKAAIDGNAASILTNGVSVSISPVTEVFIAEVLTGSGSIPTASPPVFGVPTGESDTPKKKKLQEQIDVQDARELEEEMARDAQRMNEQIARDAEIARIHAEEELQMMIDGLERNNETVAKEVERDDAAILIEEVFVEALQVKHPIIEWEVHTEGERSYWKIIRRGGSTASYQFFVDLLKHFDKEDLNQLWALVKETLNIRPAANDKEKEIWVELKRLYEPDVEDLLKDLNQLWALVKETLNIRPATNDKEIDLWVKLKRLYEPDVEDLLWTHNQNMMHALVEWKLYNTYGVHQVISKDKEIFMLVENDYPLRKGLAIVMICYKLQVENYSQMANDLILKIYKIANSPSQQDD
nr:copia protein [Tanacetum cinerariifolium]